MEDAMKELIEFNARALVKTPDAVKVNVIEGQKITILELSVAPDETGLVIGQHGMIADALRIILKAASYSTQRHYDLQVVDS